MGSNESNGHRPEAPAYVSFGPAEDDQVPIGVASKMLTALLEREDKLFTVLLGEAMTGVRLSRTLHRAGPAVLAERAAIESGRG